MSVLLSKIRSKSPEAARVFKLADLRSDSDIRSLTREDLNELFPGPEKLKLRRAIFQMIEQKPINELLKEMKDFLPSESFRAALTSNGVLVDYLCILKDMKIKLNDVQDFVDAHIGLLEEYRKDQPDQESDKGSLSGTRTSDTCEPMALHDGLTGGHTQGVQDCWPAAGTSGAGGSVVPYTGTTGGQTQGAQTTVIFQSIVSGETFGSDKQLMDKVRNQAQDQVRFVESDVDHKVTVVFCPVVSHVECDVDAAMSDVKDDKPVILVLMHRTSVPKYTPSLRTWSCGRDAVLHVQVFCHGTVRGLLSCQENDLAVSEIRRKLQEYGTRRRQDPTGTALVVGAESGHSHVGGGNKNRGSDSSSRKEHVFVVSSSFKSLDSSQLCYTIIARRGAPGLPEEFLFQNTWVSI